MKELVRAVSGFCATALVSFSDRWYTQCIYLEGVHYDFDFMVKGANCHRDNTS